MFRRVYSQVLGMLVLSTAVLICLLGFAVCCELRSQLTTYGQANLSRELDEVTNVIPSFAPRDTCKAVTTPSDDSGHDFYYTVVNTTGNAVVKTSGNPVPIEYLQSKFHTDGFNTFTYQGRPYRILKSTVSEKRTTCQTFIYTMIVQERNTIHRVTHLMIILGSIGLIFSVGLNIFVATRALKPAQRTWNAYQDSMLELSHELQTPLATAKAILDTRSIDKETKADLQDALDRASNMVTNILYLSRLRSQESNHNTIPVAVSDITEEVVERFLSLAQTRGITISGQAEPGLFVDTTIESWDRLVSTILKNVVDHAAEHSTATWSLSHSNQTVSLVVQNITLQEEPAVGTTLEQNEPFAHGFGLRIVHKIIGDMHGKISIKNDGEAVTVMVEVPLLRD